MKKRHSAIILAATICFLGCHYLVPKQDTKTAFSLVDSANYKMDTGFEQVLLDTQKCDILLLRSKLNEHIQPFDSNLASPVTLAIFNHESQLPLLLKHFEGEPDDYPYIVPSIFKANGTQLQQPGPLFLSFEKGYGGSGSSYQLYWIQKWDKTARLVPVLKSSGELSYPYFMKNGHELLLFEAIWNMDQGEAHFSDHRIQITKIVLANNQVIPQLLGVTDRKYPVPDNDASAKALINLLKQQESRFLALLNF